MYLPGLFCPPRATPCWLHLASRAHSPHPGVILDSCPSVLPTPSPASPDKSACKACGAHQGSLLLCPCTSAPFHRLPASPLVLQCPLYAEQREASNPCAGYPPVCLKLCRLQSQTLITRPPWQPLLPAPTPPFAPFQYRRTCGPQTYPVCSCGLAAPSAWTPFSQVLTGCPPLHAGACWSTTSSKKASRTLSLTLVPLQPSPALFSSQHLSLFYAIPYNCLVNHHLPPTLACEPLRTGTARACSQCPQMHKWGCTCLQA